MTNIEKLKREMAILRRQHIELLDEQQELLGICEQVLGSAHDEYAGVTKVQTRFLRKLEKACK